MAAVRNRRFLARIVRLPSQEDLRLGVTWHPLEGGQPLNGSGVEVEGSFYVASARVRRILARQCGMSEDAVGQAVNAACAA